MRRKTGRSLAGTARCVDCGAASVDAGDGTLVIRHAAECPNGVQRWRV